MQKTIISFTPLALDKDSRTLKMAVSFARAGYRSVVVQLFAGKNNYSNLGIEMVFLNAGFVAKPANFTSSNPSKINLAKKIWHWARAAGLGKINDFISYLLHIRAFRKKYNITTTGIPKADIYYFHSYEFVNFAKQLPKEAVIVYDAHDFYSEINPQVTHSNLVQHWLQPYQNKLELQMIKQANIFITVSAGLSKKYNLISAKTPFVIRNAHDKRLDSKAENSIRSYLKLGEKDFIVCVVGNFKLGMAVNEAMQAFTGLPETTHLVFVGGGYEQNKKISKNVHFVPALLPEQIVPFIQSADLGMVLYYDLTDNYQYALPNGFFQLIAAALPLIYSLYLREIQVLNEQFNFGVAVDVKNVNAIIKAVQLLTMDGDYLKKLQKNAGMCHAMLNWENEEKVLYQLLNI